MPVYVINDSLSRLLYKGLKLSRPITCMESGDEHLLFCRHIDSSDGVRVELVDKWNVRIVIDSKHVVVGSSSYYIITGGAGRTLFYALKTLSGIPVYRSLGLGFTRGVEVIDYGDMIIVVLEDVVAVVGKDGYVSVSDLFISYEEESLSGEKAGVGGERLQNV